MSRERMVSRSPCPPVLAELHVRSDFTPERRWSTMTTFAPVKRENGESCIECCQAVSSVE
jgi:hypothetical protein